MTKEDQGLHEMKFFCENQPLGSPMEEENEGETSSNKKQSLKDSGGSGGENTGDEGEDGKYHKYDDEMHISAQRERRKKMANLFSSLHALIPQLPSKADKLTIVDGAMNYIKILENFEEKLEKEKRERLRSVSTIGCDSFVMNSNLYPYYSREALVDHGFTNNLAPAGMVTSNLPYSSHSTSITQEPAAFQTWCYPNVVLNICGNDAQFCIYTNWKPSLTTAIALVLEKHKIEVMSASIMRNDNGNIYMIVAQANGASLHQFPEATSVKEIYKQAAREIMLLISLSYYDDKSLSSLSV